MTARPMTTNEVLAESCRSLSTQLQLVDQVNAGAAAARNHGIRAGARDVMRCCSTLTTSCCRAALACLRTVAGKTVRPRVCCSARRFRFTRMVAKAPAPAERRCRLLQPQSTGQTLLARQSACRFRMAVRCFAAICSCSGPIPENLRGGEDVAVFALSVGQRPGAGHKVNRWRASTNIADSLRHNRRDGEEAARFA
jgi:hypothetical protein